MRSSTWLPLDLSTLLVALCTTSLPMKLLRQSTCHAKPVALQPIDTELAIHVRRGRKKHRMQSM
eukprot:m.433834 g.433834  ORF g.433834 m.433834 type:complete len:64 (+) comp17627_c0_seq1:413-604(+)